MPASLLLGTHTYAATGAAARRQAAGTQSLLLLDRTEAVNAQFIRQPHHIEGLQTLTALQQDSVSVSGRTGPRRAVIREILDVLFATAQARAHDYFGFTNADIAWTQAAVDWILSAGREGYAFSRQNVDGASGSDLDIEISGVDAVVIATRVWPRIRHRFRPYLVGQMSWDNVYSAVLMCHASAAFENRRGLIRHEVHPSAAMPVDPFARYTQWLAALDARYFHLWCRYWDALRQLRAQQGPAEAEERLVREIFTWPPTAAERGIQAARTVKAHLRYAASRVGIR